jgi:hypothetical protein
MTSFQGERALCRSRLPPKERWFPLQSQEHYHPKAGQKRGLRKQCLKLRHKAMESLKNQYDIASCPHIANKTGFAKHMYVKEHPRLVNQIPRGSKRYNQIKKIRSASERSNSTIKEDKKIIHKPRVLNISRANILAQMAAIVLLLSRAFSFVVKTTCRTRKLIDSKESLRPKNLLPDIPKSIIRLLQIQLE